MKRKTALFFVSLIVLLSLIGCEYVPHKNYEIKTVDGQTIKLSCPEIDPARSTWTYFYDKDCYVVK